jgi:hypothetical protein
VVPLPTNIAAEDVAKIAVEAEVKCLVCSSAELAVLTPVLGGITGMRAFVVMDLPPRKDAAAEQALAQVLLLARLPHAAGTACDHSCSVGRAAAWELPSLTSAGLSEWGHENCHS